MRNFHYFHSNEHRQSAMLARVHSRNFSFLLNLAVLLLVCLIVSACGATASQQKPPLRPTTTSQAATPGPEPSRTATPSDHLSVLLPAYWDSDSSNWSRLIKTHPKGTIAIANNGDGPGNGFDPILARDITAAQKSGIKVIGYVWTGQADPAANAPSGQSEATVKATIDLWYKYYKLDGIHLDDALYTQAHIAYFQDIHDYIKQKYGHNAIVFVNGAAVPPAGYANVADIVQIYEGTIVAQPSKNYEGYQSDFIQENKAAITGWMNSLPDTTKLMAIVSNVRTMQQIQAILQISAQAHVHYVYVVPVDQSYTSLPPYWEQFVALLNSTSVPAST